MKGRSLPLNVPTGGYQKSVIPHLTGPDSVVDGENMLVTINGRYGVRPGYEQYGGDLTEIPLGAIFFRDISLNPVFVVAGASAWFKYTSGTDVWTDLAPAGDPLTGDNFTPVRFATYLQTSKVWVLGCNNTDKIKRWEPSLAEYAEISAAPICRDITILANRALVCNTEETSVRYAARIKWSSAADVTSWPADAYNDVAGAGQPNVGIRPLSRLTAALYRTESIWIVSAQEGGDATAFAPELAVSGIAGPVSPAAIVAADRAHYFFGRDNKIYRFDGVSPVVISDPIARLLDDNVDASYWDSMHGVYYGRRRELWWWVVKQGETTPKSAFVYNLDRRAWEVEQRFSVGVTTSFQAEDARTNSWDSLTVTWNDIKGNWDSYRADVNLVILLGADSSKVMFFGESVDDDGTAISFSWTHPILYGGPETKQLLPHEVEHFFETISGTTPTVKVSVYGLQHPLSVRDLLFTGTIDLTSVLRLITSSGDTSFNTANYRPGLQVEYSGSTPDKSLVEWGGASLNIYTEEDG